MKKNIIAVCDTDAEYACNFAEYLNSRNRIPFQAEAFTDVEKLCSYTKEKKPEILLIAESDVDSHVENLKNENMILLSEQKEKEEGSKCVYKYQSADSIIREVMEYYTGPAIAALQLQNRKMSVIGVYSPVSRCAKTLFALTAGQILAENKSVLYVNMEDYSGFEELFHREYEKNISDFVYGVRCKNAKSLWAIESMTEYLGRLAYLPPVSSPEDIRDIGFAEWLELLSKIRLLGKYEVVILDLGSSIDGLFGILDFCSKVYMPVLDDRISRCKIKQFQELMQNRNGEKESNIREVRLSPVLPDFGDDNFFETLLWSKWGAQVRKVLDADD